MSTYAAGLRLVKAVVRTMSVVLWGMVFYSYSVVAAAPTLIETTGEYTMGDSDEQESAIAYASYYAKQKAAVQAVTYVEAYNQEHALGLDKLSVEIAAARIIHEVKHELLWQKTEAQDFKVIFKAEFEVNADQLAEYAKPADAQWREVYSSNQASLSGIEREEARLREELCHTQNSEKAKKLTQRLRYNGRLFMAICYANEGLQASMDGRPKAGIVCYTKAVNVLPDFFGGYCMRGELHNNLGEYDMAIEDFNQAIEINPAFERGYFHRGAAYCFKKQYDLAIADYMKVLELAMSGGSSHNSELLPVYIMRSMAYREVGDFPKAVADANMVISLDSGNSGIGYYLRGMALAAGDDAEHAMDDYEKAGRAGVSPDMLQMLHSLIIKALQKA